MMQDDQLGTPFLRSIAQREKQSVMGETRIEEELRARLAAVVESSEDAIVTKSLEGIVNTWNKGAERMFGYRADEIVGKSITILIPPERIDEEAQILGKLKRGLRIEHYETIRLRKDRTPLDISLSISPLRNAAGELVGASKIARDITFRKQMENALRDEQRILELLNKTGSLIASELELDSLLQAVTDSATELSKARFGVFSYNAITDEGDSYVRYALSSACRTVFDGLSLPANTSIITPTFLGDRTLRSGDITADPRYAITPPHFGLPDARLPIRSYLAVPVVSRSGTVIGGLFFGHPDTDVFTERTERIIEGIAAQAAIAIDNARLYEDVRRAAKEREYLLEAERAARAEAERISLLKDEFLATLSHELRTPLTAILGWSQVLRSQSLSEADVEEGLSVIERNTRMQTQLIEDLLDMSRIISGKVRLNVQPVALQDIVRTAVASVRVSAEAKHLDLKTEIEGEALMVRGDPGRLQQCCWNLLSNAIKFTPRDGRIRVCLKRVEGHLQISVTDSGIGIRPDFLPHMFERFRQADGSTTRNHGGLGLGLSIVKHLVEQHGGNVHAFSEGPGHGATFSIELPVLPINLQDEATDGNGDADDNLDSQAHRFPDHPSLKGIRVLVVDDDADTLRLLQRVLQDCGAIVITAESAGAALDLVRSQKPCVIISDIGMPGQDGYELMRKLRKLPALEGGRTPAAALTAFARAEDRTRALRAGFQTHIAKPVEPTELTAMVASLALNR